MPDIIIESYTNDYKDAVASLILHIQHTEFGIPITLAQQPDLNEIASFYQVNNGNFWIAKADEKIIGTISLLDIGNGMGALRKMFVAKDYRGKEYGVGQTLLNTLINWCVQKSFTDIYLGTTEKFIAAQRFYEKHGFVEIEKGTLPKAFPVMAIDVKFYRYFLSN